MIETFLKYYMENPVSVSLALAGCTGIAVVIVAAMQAYGFEMWDD